MLNRAFDIVTVLGTSSLESTIEKEPCVYPRLSVEAPMGYFQGDLIFFPDIEQNKAVHVEPVNNYEDWNGVSV